MIIKDKIYLDNINCKKHLELEYNTETKLLKIDENNLIDDYGIIGIKNFILTIEKL